MRLEGTRAREYYDFFRMRCGHASAGPRCGHVMSSKHDHESHESGGPLCYLFAARRCLAARAAPPPGGPDASRARRYIRDNHFLLLITAYSGARDAFQRRAGRLSETRVTQRTATPTAAALWVTPLPNAWRPRTAKESERLSTARVAHTNIPPHTRKDGCPLSRTSHHTCAHILSHTFPDPGSLVPSRRSGRACGGECSLDCTYAASAASSPSPSAGSSSGTSANASVSCHVSSGPPGM